MLIQGLFSEDDLNYLSFISNHIFKGQVVQLDIRSRQAAIISPLAIVFIDSLSASLSPATSQHRPAPPAGGKHHQAARGGPGAQRQGPLPLGRHKGRTGRRRGEKREHGWRLHGGEGVPGGEREEPPFGRGGRQQRGGGQTYSPKDPGHREPRPPHGSGGSVQGTDISFYALTTCIKIEWKRTKRERCCPPRDSSLWEVLYLRLAASVCWPEQNNRPSLWQKLVHIRVYWEDTSEAAPLGSYCLRVRFEAFPSFPTSTDTNNVTPAWAHHQTLSVLVSSRFHSHYWRPHWLLQQTREGKYLASLEMSLESNRRQRLSWFALLCWDVMTGF